MKHRGLSSVWLAVIFTASALAQSKSTGEAGGTVTDPSNAVVPNLKITATAADTNLVREGTTDGQGEYLILLLPPGAYDIKAEAEGFVPQVKKGIAITVGQKAIVDLQLTLGASTQLVEVGAEIPVVEVERTQQANTLDQNSVRNLPINRRDYLTFALLAPGVADSKALADANSFRVKQTPDSGLSFYGGNGRGNSITVDGGEANDAGGGVRSTVSQETVQEFQINRANYSAEHGYARGGVINIVTKSGGNQFRGSLFSFFRHQDLDAGDPFAIALNDNRIERVKPDSTRQQFGGTLGGPIVKDRTFFFGGYEQLRRRESATVPVLTDLSIFQPTPAQNAILANLPASAAAQLRAALSAPPSTVELFQRNSGVFPFKTDDYKALFRIDHAVSGRDQLNFRYTFAENDETNQNLRGQVGLSRGFVTDTKEHGGLLGWTHTFTPSVINEMRLQSSYYRYRVGSNDPFGPELNINGFGFFNRDIFLPSDTAYRRHEIVNNLSWMKGSHALKIGTQILVRGTRNDSATFFSGRFTFGTLPGAFVSPVLASTSITALQAFNLGLAQSYQQGFGDPTVASTNPLYAVFLQDNWKLRSNLTLNLGVRYEVDTRKSPLPTDKNNVAPRFGFAWDPFSDRKTTIRGGYGIFFAPTDFQIDYVVNALNEIDGRRQIAQVLSVLNPADPLARNGPVNIFSTLRRQGVIGVPTPAQSIAASDLAQFGIVVSQTGPRPPLTVLFRNSDDFVNSYAQQASFGIERELREGFSVGASYLYSRALKIARARDDNLLPAPVNPALGIRVWSTPFFKNPLLFQDNIYESTGRSFFSGLILETGMRFSRSVSFHANYTLSRAIDEVLDFNSDFQPNDQTDLRAERALSAFHQKHKFVMYGVLQAPHAGQGQGALRQLVSDFVFSPIFRANSARPFNLLTGFDLNQDRHSTTDRPVFAGRNTGMGPSFWTFDARLSRRLPFGERKNLELMAEFFNLFNNLNFASVNNVVGNMPGPFNVTGRHDRTPSEPLGFTSALETRRVQLGVRLSF
ncbi:MAG: TonB-dependent receptor [Bryobacteraceae bacterium]